MVDYHPSAERTGRTEGHPARRLIGQVLVEGGFITRELLDRALERQRRTHELLGEALIGMGALHPLDLTAALSVQGELSTARSALRAAAGGRQLLGELLLAAKRIVPEQLRQALAEQERTGEKIGQVLVRRGVLSREELDAVLAFQERQGTGGGDPSPFRLGEILVATGQITRRQLDLALSRQGRIGGRLGELLVESGYVAPHQVSHGLAIQKKLVTVALVAFLSMASSPAAGAQESAGARPSAGRSSASIEVSASILPRTTLSIRSQPRLLVVTPGDIRRGYVEVAAASRIEIRSNDPRGYLLVFENRGGPEAPFREILVRGLEREVQIGRGGGWIPRTDARGPVAAELSYRFSLEKDVVPGNYPWPLLLSVRPL